MLRRCYKQIQALTRVVLESKNALEISAFLNHLMNLQIHTFIRAKKYPKPFTFSSSSLRPIHNL